MIYLVTIYSGFVRLLAEYAAPILHPGITVDQSISIERIQKRACKIIMGKEYVSYYEALQDCKLHSLSQRRDDLCLNFFKSLMSSDKFAQWVPPTRGSVHKRNLRGSNKLSIPMVKTERCRKSPML